MVDYSEFDDCEQNGSYCSSAKARAEISALAKTHGLRFLSNPGGGCFTGDDFTCQISYCDDVADLTKLRQALKGREQ